MQAPAVCPVCGYPGLEEPAYLPDGSPSFEICPSCDTEFGLDDEQCSHAELRQRWVDAGMPWSARHVAPPAGWNPRQQLANLRET